MSYSPLPSKNDLFDFIDEQDAGMSKRELSRAFNLSSDDRKELRFMLKELEKEGKLTQGRGGLWLSAKHLQTMGEHEGNTSSKPVTLRVVREKPLAGLSVDDNSDETSKDDDESTIATLLKREALTDIHDPQSHFRRLRKGDYILAQLKSDKQGHVTAHAISRLSKDNRSFMAIYQDEGSYGLLQPIHKSTRDEYMVANDQSNGAQEGDLVKAEPIRGNQKRGRGGAKQARIIKVLTLDQDPLGLNEIGLIEHDIPREFSDKVLKEAEALGEVDDKNRVDLTHIPFVTIDGADAKDFDDAVFAEPDPNDKEAWHIMVAIADVSWYVRPNTHLDKSALERGNSVYLPGTVIPMLPEVLSNGWCSLNPDVNRGSLVCEIWLDKYGKLKEFKFMRALIRSQARLTYRQVHDFLDGKQDQLPNIEAVRASINHLHSVWLLLNNLRQQRGALALESNERKVVIDENGMIADIHPAEHWESHEIIEELMILANVAAAKQLAKSGFAQKHLCMYRVHDGPNSERLSLLTPLFGSLGIQVKKLNEPSPKDINAILVQAKEKKVGRLVSKAVLRCQSQAQYSPDNIGHYGLALDEYCHFTSPIRRYPDLLVHRALVDACNLGDGGLGEFPLPFVELGEHCNMTERRAALCERDTLDRLTAQFLAPHVGATFEAHIDGMSRSGVFVMLDDSGASGFSPMSRLPVGRFTYDDNQGAVIETRLRKAYRLGDEVLVKLVEVSPAAGSMIFQVETAPSHDIGRATKFTSSKKQPKKTSSKKPSYPRGKRKRK
ncbi:MAG: ribonuclease R [Alphaproteobacteria bacterium]